DRAVSIPEKKVRKIRETTGIIQYFIVNHSFPKFIGRKLSPLPSESPGATPEKNYLPYLSQVTVPGNRVLPYADCVLGSCQGVENLDL
ncbi:MAG TPA: hypothetical protein PKK84_05320, partial [Armatimonadota bacterium]|nr:hypothetical protein [Armatimonadota bacterium]